MKKKLSILVLAICLIVPAIMFGGCKSNDTQYSGIVYGAEFKFLNMTSYSTNTYYKYEIRLYFSVRNTLTHQITLNKSLLNSFVDGKKTGGCFGEPGYSDIIVEVGATEELTIHLKYCSSDAEYDELLKKEVVCKYNGETFAKFKLSEAVS